MQSFLRLQRHCPQSLNNPKFFATTAKFCVRDSNPYPINTPARRRWTPYVVILACGALASLEYIAYQEWKSGQVLNPTTFTPFILVGKERASSTSGIFTLEPNLRTKNSDIYADAWRKGVWSLQVKQPQLQIARVYTPLPPISLDKSTTNGAIKFLIRKEPNGEVSEYLHKLPLGATIELRGPQVEYELPEEVDEVLFIAGGTGIAPALQIAYTLFNRRRESPGRYPKMRILWANRRREDSLGAISDFLGIEKGGPEQEKQHWAEPRSMDQLLRYSSPQTAVVKQLDMLRAKSPGSINIQYFTDEDNKFITEDFLKLLLGEPWLTYAEALEESGFDHQKKLWGERYPPGSRLILVSGPDGFVTHYAGPKAWKDGQQVQGRLGGVLKDINPRNWAVWKL